MTRRRKRHSPERIVHKLRDADAMLNAGVELQNSNGRTEVLGILRRSCPVQSISTATV